MIKLLKWMLISSLSLLVVMTLFIQTEFFQKKLIQYIETQSEGKLKIGEIKGVLPFWLSLKRVEYREQKIDAIFEDIELSLLPFSLLYGRLDFANISIGSAHILTTGREWPRFPFPIEIHRFKIDHLFTKTLENIAIEGNGVLSPAFVLHLHLQPNSSPAQLNLILEGDPQNHSISLLGHLYGLDQIELWSEGYYDWDQETFQGNLHAEGLNWRGAAQRLHLSKTTLSLEAFTVTMEGYALKGSLNYSFPSQELDVAGEFLERPYHLHTQLQINKTDLAAPQLQLEWNKGVAQGFLNYAFSTKKITGELFIELPDLSIYAPQHSLKGWGKSHLVLNQEEILWTLQSDEIYLDNLYIPEVVVEAHYHDKTLFYNLHLTDLMVLDPNYEVFPKVQLQFKGQINPSLATMEGLIGGLGKNPFALAVELPLQLSFTPLSVAFQEDSPFKIEMSGQGSIDPFLAFLENLSLIARGNIDFHLTATGSWNHPSIEGYLIYDEGWIESLTTGALFRGIHMEMEGSGNTLQMKQLSASDVDHGNLTGWGEVSLDFQNHLPFTLHFEANRYLILALDPLTATVDAQATLTGNLSRMEIKGIASLVEGHLSLPTHMPVQIPKVEVCFVNGGEIADEVKPQQKIPFHWDLTIEASRYLTIEGRGLDSEWGGLLKITGEQHALCYEGRLKLIQGRFHVINHTFDLVEGEVRIGGLEAKDITVDLKGDFELPNLTASILVRGPLDNTHLSLCSNPPMNTNQILSWILFQQDINELTPMQACRLASLLVSLSGKYSGPKTFDTIKEGLGIDVFSITDCDIDSADLTFQVGKYLSQGTFVGVNKSISGDFDSVLIQTRLFRNFYLEADYGGSLNGLTPNGGKIIFKWYRSY